MIDKLLGVYSPAFDKMYKKIKFSVNSVFFDSSKHRILVAMGFMDFYRRADIQVSMIGIVCFCCPGMFNALTGRKIFLRRLTWFIDCTDFVNAIFSTEKVLVLVVAQIVIVLSSILVTLPCILASPWSDFLVVLLPTSSAPNGLTL